MSREERLLAFIYEVTTEVMEIDSNSSEIIPQDQPSAILRKLSRKVGKADSHAIHLLLLRIWFSINHSSQ